MMQQVLVTGVAGFIGSHVADHCLRLGFNVVGVDDLSGGFRENVPPGVEFREGSITDEAFVKSLWRDRSYDFVYHLAAYAAEGLSHFIRRFNYENNLIGSMLLLNQSVLHEVKCFIFTSSIAVYGRNQVPMDEAMTPAPEDPYGIAKYAVELDLKAAHEMFGLNSIIFRPHNVYGERQNIADKYRNVIGIFMNQVLQGQAMSIFGDGTQTRAFSYINDVAPIIARSPLVEAALNQVFNVGADQPYSILELASEVARAMGADLRLTHLAPRNEVLHAFASHERVREIFHPPAPVSLRNGLQKMADWAKEYGTRKSIDFSAIEVRRNLPPSWAGSER